MYVINTNFSFPNSSKVTASGILADIIRVSHNGFRFAWYLFFYCIYCLDDFSTQTIPVSGQTIPLNLTDYYAMIQMIRFCIGFTYIKDYFLFMSSRLLKQLLASNNNNINNIPIIFRVVFGNVDMPLES